MGPPCIAHARIASGGFPTSSTPIRRSVPSEWTLSKRSALSLARACGLPGDQACIFTQGGGGAEGP